MRHTDHRAARKLFPDNPLHQYICMHIHARTHLIQNDDLALPQNRTCEAEELPLPVAEEINIHFRVQPAFAKDDRPHLATREGGDELVVRVAGFGCSGDCSLSGGPAPWVHVEAYAFRSNPIGFLSDDIHALAKSIPWYVGDVVSIDRDGAIPRFEDV